MFDQSQLAMKNGSSATVSIKDWLLLDCLMFLNLIPIVGSIAVIVIYCVIGFGNTAAPSMRARILASLIWAAIALIALILLTMFGVFSLAAYINS